MSDISDSTDFPPASTPDSERPTSLGEQILADFMIAYEARGEAAREEFLERYPELEDGINEYADAGWNVVGPRSADADQDETPWIAAGTLLGDFKILRRLRHGGMGEIYLAEQLSLTREVALKVIRPSMISQYMREKFRTEQRVLARLHDTHIVPIHIGGTVTLPVNGGDREIQYFVMPYIRGATLGNVVAAARRLGTSTPGSAPPLSKIAAQCIEPAAGSTAAATDPTPVEQVAAGPGDSEPTEPTGPVQLSLSYFRSVARCIAEIADSVEYSHRQGVCHHDIKPANIMIERNGKPWVIDFGLAKAAVAAGEPSNGTNGHTSLGGTFPYMSPEKHRARLRMQQEHGGDDSTAAPSSATSPPAEETETAICAGDQSLERDKLGDVWALGVTLYELLALRPAFTGNPLQVRDAILSPKPPPRPRDVVPGVPRDLETICLRATSKSPNERYSSAGELATDCRRWLSGQPLTGARLSRRVWLWGRRNPGWACVIALAVVLAWVSTVLRVQTAKTAAKRTSMTMELQTTVASHKQRWRPKAVRIIEEMPGQVDDLLRDMAARITIGIDAETVDTFEHPASSIAFNPAGTRLLLGGGQLQKENPSEPPTRIPVPAKIRDLKSHEFHVSQRSGPGPVTFAEGAALQLVATSPEALELWNIDSAQSAGELRVPAEMKGDRRWALLALAKDGSHVAATSERIDETGEMIEQDLFVWEVDSGKVRCHLRPPTPITAMELSADGSYFATGHDRGRVRVWAVANGKQLETGPIRIGRTRVQCLTLTEDRLRLWNPADRVGPSLLLAGGTTGGDIAIWDLQQSSLRSFARGSINDVKDVTFNPDGTLLASCGRRNAKLWDVATGKLLLEPSHRNTMPLITFSPDGQQLALVSYGSRTPFTNVIDLVRLEYDRGIKTLRGLRNAAADVCFSPDGRRLAAVSNDWLVGVWDHTTGHLEHLLEVPEGFFIDSVGLSFNHDATQLVVSSGTTASLWDLGSGTRLETWTFPPGLTDCVAFHDSGRLVSIRFETKNGVPPFTENHPLKHPRICRVRELLADGKHKLLAEVDYFDWHIFGVTAAPDGDWFAIHGIHSEPGPDGERRKFKVLATYDGNTGKRLWSQSAEDNNHGRPHVDPTGRLVVASLHGKSVFFESRTGMTSQVSPRAVNAFGPGARLIAFFDEPHRGLALIKSPGTVPFVRLGWGIRPSGDGRPQFSRDGKKFAWGSADGSVFVADIDEVRNRMAALGMGWE